MHPSRLFTVFIASSWILHRISPDFPGFHCILPGLIVFVGFQRVFHGSCGPRRAKYRKRGRKEWRVKGGRGTRWWGETVKCIFQPPIMDRGLRFCSSSKKIEKLDKIVKKINLNGRGEINSHSTLSISNSFNDLSWISGPAHRRWNSRWADSTVPDSRDARQDSRWQWGQRIHNSRSGHHLFSIASDSNRTVLKN